MEMAYVNFLEISITTDICQELIRCQARIILFGGHNDLVH